MKKSIDKITIEGKEYVPIDSIEQKEYEGDTKIVVLQRGWICVGIFQREGNNCKLYKAHNIRRWGTTEGLGELASKGPTPDTTLDKCHGVVEFDYLTMVLSITCKEDVWKNVL